MPDEWGVPLPDSPEDHQPFMLGLYDIIAEARDLGLAPEGIELLERGRLVLLDEFEAKHPGYGKGRAVWR